MKREDLLDKMHRKIRIDSGIRITVRKIDYDEIMRQRNVSGNKSNGTARAYMRLRRKNDSWDISVSKCLPLADGAGYKLFGSQMSVATRYATHKRSSCKYRTWMLIFHNQKAHSTVGFFGVYDQNFAPQLLHLNCDFAVLLNRPNMKPPNAFCAKVIFSISGEPQMGQCGT